MKNQITDFKSTCELSNSQQQRAADLNSKYKVEREDTGIGRWWLRKKTLKKGKIRPATINIKTLVEKIVVINTTDHIDTSELEAKVKEALTRALQNAEGLTV